MAPVFLIQESSDLLAALASSTLLFVSVIAGFIFVRADDYLSGKSKVKSFLGIAFVVTATVYGLLGFFTIPKALSPLFQENPYLPMVMISLWSGVAIVAGLYLFRISQKELIEIYASEEGGEKDSPKKQSLHSKITKIAFYLIYPGAALWVYSFAIIIVTALSASISLIP